MPNIPKIDYELGWRNITNLETQQLIIDEMFRIAPAKVAFGVDLLATYPKLRPDDLRRICEHDYSEGFFRHHGKGKGFKPDQQLGKNQLYRWWRRACENLGIEGLDLYGGTRHTTVTAIAIMVDGTSAQKASSHSSNKAFGRYCQAED